MVDVTCSIDGCMNIAPSNRKGWCVAHYKRWWRHGDPLAGRGYLRCLIGDCPLPHEARGMCIKHYKRWKRYGDPLKRLKRANGEAEHGTLTMACRGCHCEACQPIGLEYAAAYRDLNRERIREIANQWARRNPENSRKQTARRRARELDAFVEDVAVEVLLVRDHGRCFCGDKVDPTKRWPHPDSPSVDHVIPLSLGGEHSYANTQLAHLSCNQSKNNRPLASGEQLRLI